LRLLILKTEVDYNGRCETPVGIAGRLRPRRLAEEAQLTPHGKGASWSCNQLTYFKIAIMYTETAKIKLVYKMLKSCFNKFAITSGYLKIYSLKTTYFLNIFFIFKNQSFLTTDPI
jgi:hypothetical protein